MKLPSANSNTRPARPPCRWSNVFPALFAGSCLFLQSQSSEAQIISQYIETNSGDTPKGIEIWNQTGSAITFSPTNALVIEKGTNGAAPTLDISVESGTLAAGAVMVIGTTGMDTYLADEGLGSVLFVTKSFTFNGDDALVVKLNGVITDTLGTPGSDPGTAWTGSGVSTANQNIQILPGITSGDLVGWTDPSLRFETISTTPATLPAGLAGFGIAPIATGPPSILTLNPANNTPDADTTVTLSATFNEPIAAGAGGVQLFKEAGVTDVAIPLGPITISGDTASFTPLAPLEGTETYYVLIDGTAFTDLETPTPNPFPGISSETEWTFTTATPDLTAPSIVSRIPAIGAPGVIPSTTLTLTFDEVITAGTGTILIKTAVGGATVETIPVPDPRVSVSGDTAVINPDTILDYGASYYVEVGAGSFSDLAGNPSAVISGPSAWDFATRAAPSLLISQVYELSASGRYIELWNPTASPVDLTGYQLAVWSDSSPSDNEGWKSGTGTTDRLTPLSGTIPAGGYFLVTTSSPSTPSYAANNNDLKTPAIGVSATAFNGDDSIVLYNGPGFTLPEVEDAFSIAGSEGVGTSFYRLNANPGFDFEIGTSILTYPGTWENKTLAEVDTAIYGVDDWYLDALNPPKVLTLSFSPTSFSESAGLAASVGTVSRSGPTDEEVFALLSSSKPGEAAVPFFVSLGIGESSATFDIEAIDDDFLDGDKVVTITASVDGYTPGQGDVTVLDDPTDAVFPVVINEVDVDMAINPDSAEFIELYNDSNAPVSLDGVVLVLYNGNNDLSYRTVDLSGGTIEANGYFVIGSADVPNVDLEDFTSTDSIQNGADAVALYLGSPAEFPNGTPVTTGGGTLVDALVYDTNDGDDTGLLSALLPAGKPQVDENANLNGGLESMARLPDGGAAFDTTLFVAQAPTPGVTNIIPVNTFGTWIGGFTVGGLTGVNDDFDNDGLGNAIENILGSDPSVSNQGFTSVTATSTSVTFRHSLADVPASDLTPAYEWSTNLSAWYPSAATSGDGIVVAIGTPQVITDGSPNDIVEVTASVLSGTATKLFVRLKATTP